MNFYTWRIVSTTVWILQRNNFPIAEITRVEIAAFLYLFNFFQALIVAILDNNMENWGIFCWKW